MKKYLIYILVFSAMFGFLSPINVGAQGAGGVRSPGGSSSPTTPTAEIEKNQETIKKIIEDPAKTKEIIQAAEKAKATPPVDNSTIWTKPKPVSCPEGTLTQDQINKENALIQCSRAIACYESTETYKKDGKPVLDKDGKPKTIMTKTADPDNACDFNAMMDTVNRIINFVLFYLTIPIVAIMLAYAGVLFIASVANSGLRTKAKDIFFAAIIGLVIAFCAFLIIKLLLSILGYDGGWIGF